MKEQTGQIMGNVLEDLINTTLISILIFAINMKHQSSTPANLQHKQEISRMTSNGALNSTKVLRKLHRFNDNALFAEVKCSLDT